MYTRILVAIEHSAADATIVEHVCQLARLTHAELILVHVADGWAARHFDELALRESEEMRDDREYLEALAARLLAEGLPTQWRLGRGDPAAEIVRISRAEGVDLIAMATHGHRGINDLIRGTTVNKVRHDVSVPVLLLRAKSSASTPQG
ncbi:MAG: universal stress protein [Acidobacteria bacterium]|jgi:nucleotide-binding universal stress UspA family protein|nr:universal stress protein [Acidobacteriota bacterium]